MVAVNSPADNQISIKNDTAFVVFDDRNFHCTFHAIFNLSHNNRDADNRCMVVIDGD